MDGENSDTGMICGGAICLCYLHLDATQAPLFQSVADVLAYRRIGDFTIDFGPFIASALEGNVAECHGEASRHTIVGYPWHMRVIFVRGSCGVVQADEVFLVIRSRCAYSTDCFVGSCCVESKPRNAMSGADAARRHEDNPSWPRPVLKTPRRSEQWQKRSMCRV